MKKYFTVLLFTAIAIQGMAQLTVEECWDKARSNYPLIARMGLIENARDYTLANAAKGYLPQLQLTARATYQSDVTSLPISLPGIDVPKLPKDNYDAKLELNQVIWDGGRIGSQRDAARTSAEVDRQALEVELYKLRDRVNQLFFGILLLDGQLDQNRLLQGNMQRNYNQVTAYMAAGIANRSDLDAVKVEQLKAQQDETSMRSARKAYADMLSTMIGFTGELKLVPPPDTTPSGTEIDRPELQLFDAQQAGLQSRLKNITAGNMPTFGAFVQGGYGRPGLNMMKTGFEPYYMAGLRLSWAFGNLYTAKGNRRLVENSSRDIDTQRETFLFNTKLQLSSEQLKIQNLRDLMRRDDDIVALREGIRTAAEAKVANGTMSGTELMREVFAENLARQDRVLHRVQLLQSIYDMKTTIND